MEILVNNPGVGYRRLTMNGSQPCLMIMPDQSGLHMHHPGGTFHHFYDGIFFRVAHGAARGEVLGPGSTTTLDC